MSVFCWWRFCYLSYHRGHKRYWCRTRGSMKLVNRVKYDFMEKIGLQFPAQTNFYRADKLNCTSGRVFLGSKLLTIRPNRLLPRLRLKEKSARSLIKVQSGWQFISEMVTDLEYEITYRPINTRRWLAIRHRRTYHTWQQCATFIKSQSNSDALRHIANLVLRRQLIGGASVEWGAFMYYHFNSIEYLWLVWKIPCVGSCG